tara:strand:- start:461 stop:655 length:195 start_codon:yes stop_codon:yes gene_type:complete
VDGPLRPRNNNKLNTMKDKIYDELFEILVDLYEGIYPGNGDEWIDNYSDFLNDRTYDEIIKITK